MAISSAGLTGHRIPLPPFRRRDSDRLLTSYAQAAEDIRLARVLWDEPAGFYVDVGAGHPVRDSVTRLFYDGGWRGINIEPGPLFPALAAARRHDINVKAAIGEVEGERDFWVSFPESGLSSLTRPDKATLPPGFELVKQTVICKRLDTVLREHASGGRIGFLKIDVEGAEASVLRSFDLATVRPTVILIESIRPIANTPAHADWEPLVLRAGYVLAAFDGINRFYVPRESSSWCDVLAYPMSPLDRFVSFSEQPERQGSTGGIKGVAFPTLDIELEGLVKRHSDAEIGPLVALAVGDDMSPPPAEVLVALESVLPPGSSLIGVSRNSMRGAGEDRSPPLAATTGLAAGVNSFLRANRGDVLLVSDLSRRLRRSDIDRLCSALSVDSACATVSSVDRPVSAPVAPGIPPPGTVVPEPGIVLLRRDHLHLAIDEISSIGGADTEVVTEDLVSFLLAAVDRPGFVHRVVGTGDDVETLRDTVGSRRTRTARPRVAIDGRCLRQPLSGTQVQVLGMLGGMARIGADVSLIAPDELHPTVLPHVQPLRGLVEFVSPGRRVDVLHHPNQVQSIRALTECLAASNRLVITHQDMILDRTRSYAPSEAGWLKYRETTTAALSSADHVGFFSRHAAIDAASEGFLGLDRATVVRLGIDHLRAELDTSGDLGGRHLGGRPYMLVVGNSFWHKNRLFALRLLAWLVENRRWDGGLIFAGGYSGLGSSRDTERAFLAGRASLAGRFVDLGHVDDEERQALYRSAALVLFPSVYEGFGFIPFEAALFGVPCVYWRGSSMRELLPAIGALPSFVLAEAGPFVLNALEDGKARAAIVTDILDAGSDLTWEATAAGYLEVYARALERPPFVSRNLIVSLAGRTDSRLNDGERLLLDVYRRRPGFRRMVDSTLRVGITATGWGRLARGRRG